MYYDLSEQHGNPFSGSETEMFNEREVIIMNKVFSWIRNHKEAAEDAAGLTAFAAVTVAFFFGSGALLVVCGIAGILAIGANVTA